MAVIGSRKCGEVNIGLFISMLPATPTLIISGGARGVDSLAERYAREKGIPTEIHKPDYKAHLQGAPIRRNEDMVNACDAVLAVWDGKSKGTKYTVDYALKKGKPVFLHLVSPTAG